MKNVLKKMVIGGGALLNFAICCAQCTTTRIVTVPKPRMWFSDKDGQDRIKDFGAAKRSVLNYNTKVDQFGQVILGNFIDMLRYFDEFPDYEWLRVYIAMYSDAGSDRVPEGYARQLTLIFSPAKGSTTKPGQDLNTNLYYIIPPGKPFDATNLKEFEIDGALKDKWVKNYCDNMPISTIDLRNPTNVYKTSSCRDTSDTRSLAYMKDDIDELITEQKYCHKELKTNKQIEISKNFLVFFTAQDTKAKDRENYRITLAFEFLDPNNKPVILEKTKKFRKREVRKLDKPVDNGQLCPTVC